MKVIIVGVTGFLLLLYAMYYRKQRAREYELELEEMKKPQINVIPDSVAEDLVGRLETISRAFETKIEPDKRNYRLLIDSGERNTTAYPLPTDYQLQLPETIYGMDRISLEKAVFPMSLQLINANNYVLFVTVEWVGGSTTITDYSISLTYGNYTVTSLAAMIQSRLNAAMNADSDQTVKAVWEVSVNSDNLLMTFKITTLPTLTSAGVITSAQFKFDTSNSYLMALLGITQDPATSSLGVTPTLTTGEPVNAAYPFNLLIYLNNKAMDFNSLRIMKSSEIDSRCFANFNMPSGNGIYGGNGIPSTGTISGSAILVQGASGASGVGTYTLTKDMTNAYYEAYEGAIPSVRYINVKIRQLLPNGTVVVPDFNNSNHSMEFEMKAKVDKISGKIV